MGGGERQGTLNDTGGNLAWIGMGVVGASCLMLPRSFPDLSPALCQLRGPDTQVLSSHELGALEPPLLLLFLISCWGRFLITDVIIYFLLMAGSTGSPLCYRRALVALQGLLPDRFPHLAPVERAELSLPERNSFYSVFPPPVA